MILRANQPACRPSVAFLALVLQSMRAVMRTHNAVRTCASSNTRTDKYSQPYRAPQLHPGSSTPVLCGVWLVDPRVPVPVPGTRVGSALLARPRSATATGRQAGRAEYAPKAPSAAVVAHWCWRPVHILTRHTGLRQGHGAGSLACVACLLGLMRERQAVRMWLFVYGILAMGRWAPVYVVLLRAESAYLLTCLPA